MRYVSRGAALAACSALALGVAACGSSNDSGSTASTGAPASSTPATTTAAAGASDKSVSQASIDTGVAFTGGKAGKADASLAPVEIGYVNQEGGVPSFKEYHGVTSAAVDYVNNYLGGIAGHPLKLDECTMQTEEDGQKCGAQFAANKNIHAGILGLAVVGNQSFYKTVNGAFPVLVDVSATGPDATTPDVFALDGGGAGVLTASAQATKNDGAKSVSILTDNNPAGKNTANQVQVPLFKKLGITPKVVLFEDNATAADVASSLSNAGAQQSDGIAFQPSSPAQCNQLYDSMKQLNIVKTHVYASMFCAADSTVEHLGEGMNGWVFSSFGWNPRVKGNKQSDAYVNVMTAAGHPDLINAGYTYKSFADVMAIAQFATTVGPDKLTSDAMTSTIKSWSGPGWMTPGTMKCGWQKVLISVCGDSGQNSTFTNNTWKDLGPVKLPNAS